MRTTGFWNNIQPSGTIKVKILESKYSRRTKACKPKCLNIDS